MADRHGEPLKAIRGRPAALVAFLPGLSVRRPGPEHCREAGEGLGWLHMAAQGFQGRRSNALGQEGWAPLFSPLAGAADALQPGLAAAISQDLTRLPAAAPAGRPPGGLP